MGAWIETFIGKANKKNTGQSHPYMGAWIETSFPMVFTALIASRSHPYMGAWIETTEVIKICELAKRRTLTWVRGLKHVCFDNDKSGEGVAPLHGCVD